MSRIQGRKRRGNAFVEGALVLLPLFALLFAITDFGLAIFIKNTFMHAVREGTRYAVTYKVQTGFGHDDSIKNVVQSNAMGFLSGATNYSKIKVRYYSPTSFVEVTGNDPGNVVEVSVEGYSWGWLAPLWRSATPLNISVRSSDRMESLPGGASPPTR
ncbi:MAG: TadE/TadG family type IV pilus assembly protein [Acidobacteriota bacterium]